MKPHVVIPTRDRADWNRQHTLRQLLSAGLRVSLVVPRGQVGPYKRLLSVHEGTGLITIERCPVDGIGRVRRWITRSLFQEGVVIMLDDDLRLYCDGHVAHPFEVRQMLRDLHAVTGELSPVSGIGQSPVPSKVYACSPFWMRAHKIKFGRVLIYEDVELAMQIRDKRELTSVIFPRYSWRHLGGNALDACAAYKPRLSRLEIKKLNRLHPEYIFTLRRGVLHVDYQRA